MRVAIVQESIDPARGGAETSTREMAEALVQRGLQVSLLHAAPDELPLTADTKAPAQPARAGGVRLLPVRVPHEKTKLARTRAYLDGAGRVCREEQFDIVHAVLPLPEADVYQPRGGTYAETIARTLAITRPAAWRAVKAVLRRFNRRQRYLLHCERRLLTRPEPPWVACVSDYVRRQVKGEFPAVGARAAVVFNGVAAAAQFDPAQRAAARAQLGLAADAQVVLFIAHNFRLKGLRELLTAMRRETPVPPYHLVVAGRDTIQPYAAMASRAGLARQVHFLGPVASERLYNMADALCHPTWYDPCSRVVLEALAHGLPVVTTRYNGAAEIIRPGVSGFIIREPRDSAALADAIRSALRLATARPRVPVVFEHTMDRHAEGLHRLYDEVLRRRSRSVVAR